MMLRIAQCWDDGDVTDIRVAELMRKYHAKATFNLCPGLLLPDRRNWRGSFDGFARCKLAANELAEVYQGFQLASHTMTHVNAGEVPDALFLQEALDARHYLEDLCGRECRGFAWPCGKYTDATVQLLKSAGFAYGRTTKNTDRVLPCAEPMTLHSSCHFQNPDFRRILAAAGPDGVFYFWGHSYEMKDEPARWQALEDHLKFLSDLPNAVWVDVVDLVRPASAPESA